MSTFDQDPVLGLEELLDPARLAAAWEHAHERATAARVVTPATPAPPPRPVATTHRQLLDELARAMAAAPGLAAQAEVVLGGALAQLAAALDPVDAKAAEAALDDLEDLVQTLLATAGWPARREE